MATFWINAGKLVVCGSGRFAVQAECPCAKDCYADLIAAIRERQQAVGRTVWPAVPDPVKALPQCIAEVNALAISFVAGTYSGGTDSPTMHSGTYATGAADFCVLLELVKALVTTLGSWGFPSPDPTGGDMKGQGTGPDLSVETAAAVSRAENWGRSMTPLAVSAWNMRKDWDAIYTASCQWSYGDLWVRTTATHCARSMKLYGRAAPGGSAWAGRTKIWSAQGYGWPVMYSWAYLGTASAPIGQSYAVIPSPTSNTPPIDYIEVETPPTGQVNDVTVGFTTTGLVIAQWDFTVK